MASFASYEHSFFVSWPLDIYFPYLCSHNLMIDFEPAQLSGVSKMGF